MDNTNTRLSPSHFLGVVVTTALALLIALSVLPDDRYLRFKSLTEPEVIKAGWIYERIHFDPTPIDVVFIGTSRTVAGIDSEIVEQTCRDAGGRYCSSVNFGMLHLGRNLHWLLAREVIEARNPRLLVVEVQETEFRALHPAFPYLADDLDIVLAPLIINTSFFADLGRLPARGISLFTKGLVPLLFGTQTKFVSDTYHGSHWDDIDKAQSRVVSVAKLETERAYLASATTAKLRLPILLRQFEYRANLLYLEKLLNLARSRHIEIRFLYIPAFHDTSTPIFANFYDRFAPSWRMPEQIVDRHELWRDVEHLNYAGATALSSLVGMKIAQEYLAPDAAKADFSTK
jgi:hypothetical protein